MIDTTDRTPPGWARLPAEADGVPLWRWRNEPVYVATRDMDQLLFFGVALARFDEMTAEEFHAFVSAE